MTVAELTGAVGVLRADGRIGERSFCNAGRVVEPSRHALARHEAGESPNLIVCLGGHDRQQGQSFEAEASAADKGVSGGSPPGR